jgi:nitrate/nitrite transporter NarK
MAAILILTSLAFDEAAVIAAMLLAVKFFSDWEQPAEWGTVTDISGRCAASVFACVNTLGSLGGFAGNLLTGQVLGSGEGQPTAAAWTAVFLIIAAEYLIASASWLFIDCARPIADNPAQPGGPQ